MMAVAVMARRRGIRGYGDDTGSQQQSDNQLPGHDELLA
jgi:hypothetical protein